METTIDGFLNMRVMLEQPAKGFRAGIDTVLLAAATPARARDKVLDLGCGAGGAMICLAARLSETSVTGVDIQQAFIELCRNNIERNNFQDRLRVMHGDATKLPGDLRDAFDHVMINPPYHEEASHVVSRNDSKRTARSEKTGDLDLWLASAHGALRDGGCLTLIHRADRLDDILGSTQKLFGPIEVLPLVPKAGAAAKRAIVRAGKGGQSKVMRRADMVLHKADSSYTDKIEAILRHGAALEF